MIIWGVVMTYCQKCGTKNEDDAEYCKKCGAPLEISKKEYERDMNKRCEEECAGGKGGRGWAIFWGVIIVLVGLLIIFEVILKGLVKYYPALDWVNSFEFGWIFAAVIAIFIILFGIRILSKR
jgi:ribosomal protein L40E